jgi:hypothetical protein
VLAQDEAERLNRQKIAAACITEDVSPATRSLDSIAPASSYRGTASCVNNDAIRVIERRCEPGIAIASRDDSRTWPNLEADLLEQAAIFVRGATCEEDSRAIDLFWQSSKDGAQTLARGEPEIRRGKFPLLRYAKFRAGIPDSGYSFD